ncbi:MAG: sensor histidine kinase [Pseudomonadota bacterium]
MTRRIIAFTSIFTIIAIAMLAWFLIAQFRANALSALASVQQAHLFNLLAEVDVNQDRQLIGRPRLGDTRFEQAESGWYWQASIIDRPGSRALKSDSLGTAQIARLPLDAVPFDSTFQRVYIVPDNNGILLRVVETEFEIGDASTAIRLQTSANFSQFEAGIQSLRRNIIGVLSAFGIGLLLLNAVLIRIGLSPLVTARDQLIDVQGGKKARLDGEFPAEIAPLADEINTLIDNNKRVVERARTQVGNLAHALKTPIAVLRNEAEGKSVSSKLVSEQADEMTLYVQNYLKRAQIAAQSGGAVFRSDAVAVTEKLVRVMQKLNPEKQVDLHRDDDAPITFAGEQSDLEEILGNLLENATKWSAKQVRCSLAVSEAHKDRFILDIEDDGPGIPAENRDIALKRGKRLDEAVPGTGLGLSIVADTVAAYKGDLTLLASDLGGLHVRIELPRAH